MIIREVMTRDAKLTHPDDTLQQAARLMKDCDCGILPVADGDQLVGMITDRDIAIRCVAEGKGPNARVTEAMTQRSCIASRIRIPKMSARTWPTSRCAACR